MNAMTSSWKVNVMKHMMTRTGPANAERLSAMSQGLQQDGRGCWLVHLTHCRAASYEMAAGVKTSTMRSAIFASCVRDSLEEDARTI